MNITSNLSLDDTHSVVDTYSVVLVDTTNNPITLTLPCCSEYKTKTYVIKIVQGDNGCTVEAQENQTIDGSSSYTLSNTYDYVRLIEHGGAWHVV